MVVLRASSLQMPGDERTAVIPRYSAGSFEGLVHRRGGVAWAMNQEGGRDIMLPDEFGADLLIILVFRWVAVCRLRRLWSVRRRWRCWSSVSGA